MLVYNQEQKGDTMIDPNGGLRKHIGDGSQLLNIHHKS